jgi:hypothetical protein
MWSGHTPAKQKGQKVDEPNQQPDDGLERKLIADLIDQVEILTGAVNATIKDLNALTDITLEMAGSVSEAVKLYGEGIGALLELHRSHSNPEVTEFYFPESIRESHGEKESA